MIVGGQNQPNTHGLGLRVEDIFDAEELYGARFQKIVPVKKHTGLLEDTNVDFLDEQIDEFP